MWLKTWQFWIRSKYISLFPRPFLAQVRKSSSLVSEPHWGGWSLREWWLRNGEEEILCQTVSAALARRDGWGSWTLCKCASVQANLSGSSLGCKWVPFSSWLVLCWSTPLLCVKCVFFQPLHPLHWKMISFFILLSNLSNLAHIFSAVYFCVCYGRPGVINQMPWVANWDSGVRKRKHQRAKEHRWDGSF